MKTSEKRISKEDFIIEILAKMGIVPICNFCKYSINNYVKKNDVMMIHFNQKCHHCINCLMYKSSDGKLLDKMKKKTYIEDMYKPLYNWEEKYVEGDGHG